MSALSVTIILIGISLVNASRPNVVLFLTDDQDLLLDGLIPMAHTINMIGNEGLTFSNAYIHSPICCPSRSALLTGKYLHNIHVFNNSLEGNCSSELWQQTHEPNSIANLLKLHGGYVNFYAGKYLNQYGTHSSGLQHIPTGFDWWYGLKGNSVYYNYTISINGTAKSFTNDYLTDKLGHFAEEFLYNRDTCRPFFMILATPAPHAPFTPAPRHENAFPNVKTKKTQSFNASVAGKHWLLHLPPEHLPQNIRILDDIQRKRMQSLLAVDELVKKVIDQLTRQNLIDNTYLIFTSDNGFHIGQFGMPWDKRQPYQTDVKVPFLMRGPNIQRKKMFNKSVTLVDLAPTILDLVGCDIPADMDGQSFASHIVHKGLEFSYDNTERFLFFEYYGEGSKTSQHNECHFSKDDVPNLNECTLENWCKCEDSRNNTYGCVIDTFKHFKYCEFNDDMNFIEVYDLGNDFNELYNLNNRIPRDMHTFYKDVLNKFKQCSGKTCHNINLI